MIKYALKCAEGHRFEGWFSSSADYDGQAADGLLACPVCSTAEVGKDVMAPAISTARRRESASRAETVREALVESARRARDYVEKNFEHVGKRFPEEARRIHYGETEARGIYGEASAAEVRELKEEGVAVAPVPSPPPKPDEVKRKLN
jgi:hypothetical protein